ncbi:acid protease [Mycena maculata]|uniref:Acid protease n=1 Tax=Mycena maculata TaxID=230809 RepID=A0AAD7HKE5_9AGAR|nr:acid protease [Mycena maculata]
MQLSLSFSALLAGVLVALSVPDVQAAPYKRAPKMVTLPLKRIQARSDVHPQILLQQNLNRASRRLARFTGREAPSDEVLTAALHKRVLEIEGPEGLERRIYRVGHAGAPSKRFNRTGVPSKDKDKREPKKNGKKGGAAAAGAGTAAAGAGTAATGSTPTGANTAIGGPDSATGVEVADTPTTSNSLGLNIEGQDIGYLATIQLGTPPQNYLILMDSGSADFWVPSEACQSTAGGDCGNHLTLGSQSSSSFVATTNPFQVTYGTGAVEGAIISDDVTIAGLTLNNHTFGVTTQETTDFSDDSVPFDGLMGLALSSLSEQQTPTPVESLASNGLISDAITSYKISRESDDLNDGEITFGATDPTKFVANTLVTIPNVNTQGFWEGALDDITVDGGSVGLQGRTAILDTGTSLAVAPLADATALFALINGSTSDGQGGFTVPCTFNQSIALTFGGTSFAIEPQDIAVAPVDANDPTGDCTAGIGGGSFGTSDTEWLVGDTFLKNAYYSTDVGKNQISLAKLS